MSIAVPLEDLADRLQEHPWGYLVTVRDDGRAQTLAVPTRLVDGALVASEPHEHRRVPSRGQATQNSLPSGSCITVQRWPH